ncbi:MAG: ribonuclease P protein component [bacterium]|jgi:ribonuclease P protein component
MKDRSFPKSVRLNQAREIRRIFAKGAYRPLGLLSVKFLPRDQASSRFLISIKKKVGHAPMRNRIKRLMREAIRLERHRLERPHDLCFMITRTPNHPVTLHYLCRVLRKLFVELNESPQ